MHLFPGFCLEASLSKNKPASKYTFCVVTHSDRDNWTCERIQRIPKNSSIFASPVDLSRSRSHVRLCNNALLCAYVIMPYYAPSR